MLQVFQEAEKLASLRHPCVMAFYGIVTDKGSSGTVAEYICHGSLRSGLNKIKKKVGAASSVVQSLSWHRRQGLQAWHAHPTCKGFHKRI